MLQGKLRPFLLGLSLAAAYVIGCTSAHVVRPIVSAQGTPGVQQWEYLCLEGRNAATIQERANTAGAGGWEMVAAGHDSGIWCFKRAL